MIESQIASTCVYPMAGVITGAIVGAVATFYAIVFARVSKFPVQTPPRRVVKPE